MMPLPRVLRPRFGLKSLLVFTSVVALLLVTAYPAWKEHVIRSTVVRGRPTPFWWPQSWHDYLDSLLGKQFEFVYTFGELVVDQGVMDALKIELGSFIERRTPISDLVFSQDAAAFHDEIGYRPALPPKLQWSSDGRTCTVRTMGRDHRDIYSFVAALRTSLAAAKRKVIQR